MVAAIVTVDITAFCVHYKRKQSSAKCAYYFSIHICVSLMNRGVVGAAVSYRPAVGLRTLYLEWRMGHFHNCPHPPIWHFCPGYEALPYSL
jgi:hypothetical protein